MPDLLCSIAQWTGWGYVVAGAVGGVVATVVYIATGWLTDKDFGRWE